jgi:hypothetical protein
MIISRREALDLPIVNTAALEQGFVLAMQANIALSEYGRPAAIHKRMNEWIIVSRWGQEGEYLSISTTGECVESPQMAPSGIRPRNTMLGLLVSDSLDEPASSFLLVRQPPRPLHLAGVFFPAEGYAYLEGPAENLRLSVRARFSHSRGYQNGREILKDIPDPAPAAPESMAWLMDAERRPWIGDLVA